MTRTVKEAPGVARLRSEEQRTRPTRDLKRVYAWITPQPPKRKRPVAVSIKQMSLDML